MGIHSECEAKIEPKPMTENGYDSQEDLEHLVRISVISKSTINSKMDKLTDSKKKTLSFRLEKNTNETTICRIRVLNVISIMCLLFTFYTISFVKMNRQNYFLIIEYLKQQDMQSDSNTFILFVAMSFVTCILILFDKYSFSEFIYCTFEERFL
jgi:hypothetical protein